MAMVPESENYKKILKLLRSSKPTLLSTKEIENEVIKKISITLKPKYSISDVIDFFFGWVYINWVRRSLITCSVLLIMVFVWQQSIILKRINNLRRETITVERETSSKRIEDIERMLTRYSKSGGKLNTKTMDISEVEVEELLMSFKELQVKYKDLENLINSDPELKKYIGKKLEEKGNSKFKL
jgi:hypothetical protein